MSDEKPMHPVVFHTIGTIMGGVMLPVVGGIFYLAAVSSWHSLLAVGNAFSQGRIGWKRHFGWTVTAMLLALVVAFIMSANNGISGELAEQLLAWASFSLMVGVLCFLLVGLLRIPGGIWQGIRALFRSRAAARNRARQEAQLALQAREQADSRRHQSELASSQRSDARRRLDARSRCEMAYALYAPEIRDRFPKAAFDQFLQTYMHDAIDASDVERRAVELQGIIEQHRRLGNPKALQKPKSLEDITRWYIDERKRIQGMEVDEEIKSVQQGLLEQRYAELSERFLTTCEP